MTENEAIELLRSMQNPKQDGKLHDSVEFEILANEFH